uniref:Uncharacterized protein n=1 Tax=Arundo donax TaxID=35708 RepID=A0A0A9EKM2_ARUDO
MIFSFFLLNALHEVVIHICWYLLSTKACHMTICFQLCQT